MVFSVDGWRCLNAIHCTFPSDRALAFAFALKVEKREAMARAMAAAGAAMAAPRVKVAVAQMTAGSNTDANFVTCARLVQVSFCTSNLPYSPIYTSFHVLVVLVFAVIMVHSSPELRFYFCFFLISD